MRITIVAAALLVLGCDAGRDTRTFRLQHMDADEALAMVQPYVGETGSISAHDQPPTLSVSAPPERLLQIAEVLGEYDRPKPNVRLRFQVIEANGFTGTDPAIADVQQALQDLFRFEGYRLVAEAVVHSKAGSHVEQRMAGESDTEYQVMATLTNVFVDESRKAVEMEIRLTAGAVIYESLLQTGLTAPSGQTIVVGSAPGAGAGSTVILVVRPEIE